MSQTPTTDTLIDALATRLALRTLVYPQLVEELRAFAGQVAAVEREACAVAAETEYDADGWHEAYRVAGHVIADSIRDRGQPNRPG